MIAAHRRRYGEGFQIRYDLYLMVCCNTEPGWD